MRLLLTSMTICSLILSGLEGLNKTKDFDFSPGTYGDRQVVLSVNKNGTYNYIDKTLKVPLELKGNWSRTGNVIVLGEMGGKKIHDHWKIEQGCPCLKARKGMEWRRLCLVSAE